MPIHDLNGATSQYPLDIVERTGSVRLTDFIGVLKGEIAGVHVKEAFNAHVADELTRNFFDNPGLRQREIGVLAQNIGASQYSAGAREYFTESESTRDHIDHLLGAMVDPVRSLFEALGRELGRQGIELRLTRSEHGQANVCRASCWTGTDAYSLEPHDDVAQVLTAGSDYELAPVAENTVVAVNFYPSVPGGGGSLRVWDHRPTAEDRRRQGVETTGYPYSDAYLQGMHYRDLLLGAGDIVLLDGGLVHGVPKQLGDGRPRLLLNGFAGFARPDLVLWWT